MIVHLDGDFETVDYTENRSVLIYDNVENEEYPVHWHNAIEIIMPLTNPFTAVCDGKVFDLKERDILIIPAGTLHTLKAQPGRRLIMLFDNRSISTNQRHQINEEAQQQIDVLTEQVRSLKKDVLALSQKNQASEKLIQTILKAVDKYQNSIDD